eukprot:8089289-Pyramimonas_sp.AAC.1
MLQETARLEGERDAEKRAADKCRRDVAKLRQHLLDRSVQEEERADDYDRNFACVTQLTQEVSQLQ